MTDGPLSQRLVSVVDLELRLSWMLSEPVRQGLNLAAPPTREGTAAWFSRVAQDSTRLDYTFLSNFSAQPSTRVAMGGLTNIDTRQRRAELYLFVDPTQSRQGYGRAATTMLVSTALDDLNLRRVFLKCFADNQAAASLYASCGFVLEGRLRQHSLSPRSGQPVDRLVYGINQGDERLFALGSSRG